LHLGGACAFLALPVVTGSKERAEHMSTDKAKAVQPPASTPTTQTRVPTPPPPPPAAIKSEAKPVENGTLAVSEPVVEVKREIAKEPVASPGTPLVIVAGTLTREQKLALFADAFAAEKEVKKAEAAVETAALVLSDKIKLIITALGGKQGPWNVFDERDIRARMRGDIAYFLRRDDAAETI
jgi:hypothetical protein